jgi:hypothetical protein
MTSTQDMNFIAAMMAHPKGREIMLRSMASIIQEKLDPWRSERNKAVALSPSETLANRDRIFPEAFTYEIDMPLAAIDNEAAVNTRWFLRDGERKLRQNEMDLQDKIRGLVPLPLVITPVELKEDGRFGFQMIQRYAMVL